MTDSDAMDNTSPASDVESDPATEETSAPAISSGTEAEPDSQPAADAGAAPADADHDTGTDAHSEASEATASDVIACPACGENAPAGSKYCESCGADLAASPADAMAAAPCVSCGAPPQDIIADGYCSNCGQKQPARRDHLEIDEGPVAAVTDRGKRHHRNEDAVAIWSGPERAVVVVCDGVSSTDRPDDASQAAADTACDQLSSFLTSDRAITALSTDSTAQATTMDTAILGRELTAAIAAAHQAVAAVVADNPSAEPPSCTIVASVVHWKPEPAVSVAWLGDSRGYWVEPDGTVEQVTADHSWANQQRELGNADEAAIAADPRAHSITRWLGADAVDIEPDIVHLTKPDGGRWLACSDGLWNYADSAAAMSERIAEFDGSPLELAERLTTFANDAGGHDNITVAIASTPSAAKDGEP